MCVTDLANALHCLFIPAGFSSIATESSANEILEMLLTGTLDTLDQLSSVLGINPSTPTTGLFVLLFFFKYLALSLV